MSSSLNCLPPPHPPGRSKTVSAWAALIGLLFLMLLGFFYSFVFQKSIDALLWASRPFTGVTIHAETLKIKLGEPLRWKNITITSGLAPHQSHLELQKIVLSLNSPWRIFFGDHVVIRQLEASTGKGLLDLRHEPSASTPSFFQEQRDRLHALFQKTVATMPASFLLHDISLLCITENQRYSIDHFSCTLPQKEPGTLSYESMLLEAGTIRCHLGATSCKTIWDGKTITLKNLSLANEVRLHRLQLTAYPDRLEWGFAATLFHGLVRADGCLRKKDPGPALEGAMLAQQLPMERLSKFLGLQKKIAGTLREGRLTFRGSLLHPIDAEASLRVLVDHFCLEKKDWASLSITSNLIGRKISVTDFQLKQQENRLNVTGEMSLPEEWHKIGEAPFHLKLQANIADAAQLTDLIGTSWNDVAGKIFMDGDVNGAANHAEGYLHLQGVEMALDGLPIDTVESMVLFQGEKTTLSNLDFWSGSNHVQLAGTIANSWPHAYEAQGNINYRNFFEKLKPLAQLINHDENQNSIIAKDPAEALSKQLKEQQAFPYTAITEWLQHGSFLKMVRNQFLQAHWSGHGTATAHEGSFECSLSPANEENKTPTLQCAGSYTPELLTCSALKINFGDKMFSTSLALSPQKIELRNLMFEENKNCANDHERKSRSLVELAAGDAEQGATARRRKVYKEILDEASTAATMQCGSAVELCKRSSSSASLKGPRTSILAGTIILPCDGISLLHGNTTPSLFQWNTPMEINLLLHHFSLDDLTPFFDIPISNILVSGSIKSSGLWSEPALDLALNGTRTIADSKKSPWHLQLHAKKGEGLLDAALRNQHDQWVQLQGTLPVGLTHVEEGAPFQSKDQLTLNPLQGPFHLALTLPEVPLDFFAAALLPKDFSFEHGTIAGAMKLEGNVIEPNLSGHLEVKADACAFGSILPACHEVKAHLGLSKEKITLENFSALLGKGKLEASGSSTGALGEQHHDYHITGHDLLFYQHKEITAKGTAALALQGDGRDGKLTGDLTITELNWKPQLMMTPFLVPPGLIAPSALATSTEKSAENISWTSNVTLHYQPEKNALATKTRDHKSTDEKNSYFKNRELQLLGTIAAPAPEGAAELADLSVQSPHGPLHFLQGTLHFRASRPWIPYCELTAETTLQHNTIVVHLNENAETPFLFFESTQPLAQETAALLLAKPNSSFSSPLFSAGWIAELPYWIRAQEINEPTNFFDPDAASLTAPEASENLGFAGSGVFCNTQLK